MFDSSSQKYNFDNNIKGDNNYIENDVDLNFGGYPSGNNGINNYSVNNSYQNNNGRERIVQRTFVHEVPHVCPIHTRIINHHVYKHTYKPEYTCSEENTVSNVQCGSCCQFK